MTRRGRLRELLKTRDEGFTLKEIQDILETNRGTTLTDLRHLQLSLRHTPEVLLMNPAACRECGFTFRAEEPKAPSRCPACKGIKIADPVFKVASTAMESARSRARA